MAEDNNESVFKNNKSETLNRIELKLDAEGKYVEAMNFSS